MWGEAILSSNYLLNKVLRKKAENTPYELWKGIKSSYKYLQVWGCLAKVVIPPPKKVKIRPKMIDYIFIGYTHNSVAYRFHVHESNIPYIHKNTTMNRGMHHSLRMCFHVDSRKSLVHQNEYWRLFMKIVRMKILMER